MFILKDQITAWWPVKVNEPNPKSPGTFTRHTFEVEFTLLDQDEANARNDLRAELLNSPGDPGDILKALQNFDAETFADRITDWRGVFDNDKKEVPYSREMFLKALKRPHILVAVSESYEEMARGKVRSKN